MKPFIRSDFVPPITPLRLNSQCQTMARCYCPLSAGAGLALTN